MDCKMNVLMIVDVGLLLGDAWFFNILASAGHQGLSAVNELATDHGVVGLSYWLEEVEGFVPVGLGKFTAPTTSEDASNDDEQTSSTLAITTTTNTTSTTAFVSPRVFSNASDTNIMVLKGLTEGYALGCTYHDSLQFHIGCRHVTRIGNGFLEGCCRIETIDLGVLEGISEIGTEFLARCTALTSIDLAPLSDITEVPSNFMMGCSSIKNIDLSPLRNISAVWSNFLRKCSSLRSIDLTPLSRITIVESGFLVGCEKLVYIDTTPLLPVTRVGAFCMAHCTELQGVNLQGFFGAKIIGPAFLRDCTSLLHIDLSPLRQTYISVIGNFLSGCTQLLELDLNPLAHALSKNALVLDNMPEVSHIYLATTLRSQVNIGTIKKKGPDGLETRIIWQDQKGS